MAFDGIGPHACLQVSHHPRFLAQGKGGSDLHPHSTGRDCRGETVRGAVLTRQPERKPKIGHRFEVDLVARSVHRLAIGVELLAAPRRGVVTTCGWHLDHQAVGAGVGVANQELGKRNRADHGEERRPLDRRIGHPDRGRIETGEEPTELSATGIDDGCNSKSSSSRPDRSRTVPRSSCSSEEP